MTVLLPATTPATVAMATQLPSSCGPAPPEAIYTDTNILFAVIQAHASKNGYAFRIRSSTPIHVVYYCDRAGNYDSKGKNLTVHPSKQCTWLLKVFEVTHNHMASISPVAHSAHRIASLDSTIRNRIESLWRSGVANAQILSALYIDFPDIYLASVDIRNMTQLVQNQELGGRTPIQDLLTN
ncbi:hypothetical protein B7463_g9951, partial [Scytalidium lignicola]